MTGKVDAQERHAECECNGVPGMSILRTTMKEHNLWFRCSPFESREFSVAVYRDEFSGNHRGRGVGDAVFRSIFMKHSEFVV